MQEVLSGDLPFRSPLVRRNGRARAYDGTAELEALSSYLPFNTFVPVAAYLLMRAELRTLADFNLLISYIAVRDDGFARLRHYGRENRGL